MKKTFFLRPPHWASREDIRAFVGTKSVPVKWSGSYVRFDVGAGKEITITYPLIEFTHEVKGLWSVAPALKMTFHWRGNSVVSAEPIAKGTPLFTDKPRVLPEPPKF